MSTNLAVDGGTKVWDGPVPQWPSFDMSVMSEIEEILATGQVNYWTGPRGMRFEQAFAEGVDAILTPATPSAAFGLGEMSDADPVQMYLNDVFTVTVNLAGLPGIAVPAGVDGQGLPMGLQLIGRPWEEGDLLNTAYALERAAGFVAKPGKWW